MASIANGGGRGPPYGPSATEDGRREGSKRTSTFLHFYTNQPINQFLLFLDGAVNGIYPLPADCACQCQHTIICDILASYAHQFTSTPRVAQRRPCHAVPSGSRVTHAASLCNPPNRVMVRPVPPRCHMCHRGATHAVAPAPHPTPNSPRTGVLKLFVVGVALLCRLSFRSFLGIRGVCLLRCRFRRRPR